MPSVAPWLYAWTAGALCGFAVHHGIFIRGEWHVKAPRIVVGHVLTFMFLHLLSTLTRGTDLFALCHGFVLMSYGYLPGLFLSMTIYRVFFHRLTRAGFPGPWYARVTKLWHVWACRDSMNHVLLDKLHKKYGDFVRTGPSEISICRPEIFMATDGPHSECKKADWYDLLKPNLALVSARDRDIHAVRRRQWNRAFSAKALKIHEQKVVRNLDELDRRVEIDARTGNVSQAKNMFYWFAFDAMGEFVLGKSFGMQQKQEWHHIIVRMQNALSMLGPLSPTPWLIHIGFKLVPRVYQLRDWFSLSAWCRAQMRERLEDKSRHKEPDITHFIMMEDEENEEITKNALLWLSGDSMQAMAAGSSPIANTLLGLFTEVGRTPGAWDKLYDEIQGVDISDVKALAVLPYLNACIDETLRLYPALMTGGARMTTQNGMTVAGRYIPPYTNILAPQYLISRREDCFVDPCRFVPERWTTAPEMVLNPSATRPFGMGHLSCIGKPLAMDALRLVISRLTKKYRFRYAPGEDGSGMWRDMKDQFVQNPGQLRLCFELR